MLFSGPLVLPLGQAICLSPLRQPPGAAAAHCISTSLWLWYCTGQHSVEGRLPPLVYRVLNSVQSQAAGTEPGNQALTLLCQQP